MHRLKGGGVDVFNKILAGTPAIGLSNSLTLSQGEPPSIKCSFCGKKQGQVVTGRIISGPGANICAECVDLCNEILSEELFEENKSANSPVNANLQLSPVDQLSANEQRQLRIELKQRIARESSKLTQPQTAGERAILDSLNIIMTQLTAIKERLDELEARKPD